MLIRDRATGAVMFENEWRSWLLSNGGPSFGAVTPDILEALNADPVFEGPQASGGQFWQYSMRDGVEQIDGKWYTKYVLGPIFTGPDAAQQQAEYIAAKTAERNAKLQTSIVDATQKRLDDFAQTRGYDGILSACTYVTSTVEKFAVEGSYCVEARDATWSKLYEILAEVEAGARPLPSGYADVESDLPSLAWPV